MILEDVRFIGDKIEELGVWDKLRRKRILMTGGTGFIGRWFDIPGLDIFLAGTRDYSISLQGEWDYIIHAAPCEPHEVVDCAIRNKAKLLLVSSGAVYDDPETDLARDKKYNEEYVTDMLDDYVIARVFSVAGYNPRPGRFALDTFIRQGMAGEPILLNNGGESEHTLAIT